MYRFFKEVIQSGIILDGTEKALIVTDILQNIWLYKKISQGVIFLKG